MEHRHAYTVLMKKRNMAATVVVVLLSIVLIAGIIVLSPLGDYLMEHVVQPIADTLKPEETKDDAIVSALKNQEQGPAPKPSATPEPIQNSLNIIATPYYILQMGAFTDVLDAQAHAQKIRSMGAAGFVYEDGSVYRVFAAAYLDQESLSKVQSQVRTDGFEATPYITDQNSVHITLKGDQIAVKATENAIAALSEVPNTLSDLSLQFDKGAVDDTKLRTSLKDLQSAVNQALSGFSSVQRDSVEPICSVLEKYQNHISTFLTEHDTMSRSDAGELKLLQLECIIDYIQLFERK